MNSKYRTFEERQIESLNIIFNLKKNGYTSKETPIRELLDKLNDYVQNDIDLSFSIPFVERNITIIGKLYRSKQMENEVIMKKKTN
jgi:DNA-binding transcriptional MerR regulator